MALLLTDRLVDANNTLSGPNWRDTFRSNDELHAVGPVTVRERRPEWGPFV
jgi:hypothetical protein